ncbi:Uncharacterized protein BM_BM13107 [Brugia malayi]|uniref:Bm13107 n=1 Tax=Brugia malayi TaxID=6279 RepID=A0A4E9FRW2_BRUMA|nr:Uncharacterized protein BM_BM13107 [Brugia malayi]VIO98489.1 Uncharacterized protein BM_BM13107 [Brugia malayi]
MEKGSNCTVPGIKSPATRSGIFGHLVELSVYFPNIPKFSKFHREKEILMLWVFVKVKRKKKLHERSKGIDREINESAIESAKAIKLLLLDTGDSGKSTLLKQMSNVWLYSNTIHAMDDILKVMERCSIKFSEPARKDDSAVIAQAISTESKSITYEIATAIKNLWQDPAIQNIYERRHDHNLHESAKQFGLI